MNTQQLLRLFEPHEIKVREGKKGMSYQYVSSHTVVNRLNEIGPFHWNFVVKDSKLLDDEVVVLGSLTIGTTTKEAYGSAAFMEKNSAGDSFKTASALALTKAASLFGIPCIFHSKKGNYTQQYGTQQQNNSQRTDNTAHNSKVCDDCSNEISQAEVKFTLGNTNTYKGKKLCRSCQQKYRGRA